MFANKIVTFVVLGIVVAVMPAWAGEGAATGGMADYVTTPILLQAKDVLPAKLLQGENYSIVAQVQNDGLDNTYQLTTPYGPLTVESTAELMVRIAELNAMRVMEEMDKKKVFGDAVIAGVKAPVKGAVALVTEPVETTTNIVKGTGQFLSNLGRSIVSDDPHQDNALKVALGYDTTKRVFAYELGINPYSNYQPVISMLGSISQASVAGGLAPRAAMAAVDSDVVTVMRISGTAEGMRKLVRDNPPGELQKINSAKLADMGVSTPMIEALLSNYIYDPQEQTLLVGELETLKGVKGREEFVAAAALASDRQAALFYRTMAGMMAGYHAQVAPAKSIGRIAGTPCLRKADGTVVLVGPVDFIFRTAEVEAKLKRLNEAIEKTGSASARELWITGRVDASGRQMLAQSGWTVVEKADERLMQE